MSSPSSPASPVTNPLPRYVCIHGHFYQPPRENPWLGQIEVQSGAAPFHDWNARITAECYRPNAASRIVDNNNRVLDLQNNYEKLSFNFGPTLLSWMDAHAPDVLEAIVEADRRSVAARSGHGNAIAQVYNHMIMPLATQRDKRTQILWGLEDFRRRFHRDPEGMWLAETAVDTETLSLLAECGIKFTILAPYQARRFRSGRAGAGPASETSGARIHPPSSTDPATLGAPGTSGTPAVPAARAERTERAWKDASASGGIDPTRAYACPLPNGRSITLFFYDGPISRAVAFEGILRDGNAFAERLAAGFRTDRPWAQLVHSATDGETFGHHHRFGEMGLTYALHLVEEKKIARLTNYGEYLALHPPAAEAEIHENTSWSCAHGIERWRSDCGCRIAEKSGWNQKWRGPLRDALDTLRAKLDALFEDEARRWFADPWAVRDDYIRVILNRTEESVRDFFRRHTPADMRDADRSAALDLLEIQHNRMLMYTSCGWFFDELSGIETVQDLRYAARALQLAARFRSGIENEFFARLALVPSNVYPDGGADVWEQHVAPLIADLPRVLANFAIARMHNPAEGRRSFYAYDIEALDNAAESFGQTRLTLSRLRILSRLDFRQSECIAAVLHFGGHDFHCALRGPLDAVDFARIRRELIDTFRRRSMAEVMQVIDHHFETRRFSVRDLFDEEREKLLRRVTRQSLARFESLVELIYDELSQLMEYVREQKAPLPAGFLAAAEQALQIRIERAFLAYLETGQRAALDELIAEAKTWKIHLASPHVLRRLQELIDHAVRRLREEPRDSRILDLLRLLDLVEALGVETQLGFWEAQTVCFAMLYPDAPSPWTPKIPWKPANGSNGAERAPADIPDFPPSEPPAPLSPESRVVPIEIPFAPGEAMNKLAHRLRIATDSPLRARRTNPQAQG